MTATQPKCVEAAAPGDWPEEGLETLGACPVCAGTGRSLVHAGLRDGLRGDGYAVAPGRWNLYRCAGCGAGYLDPRPNVESIGMAYLQKDTPGPVGQEDLNPRSAWRRYRAALRNGYLNAHYGYQLTPAKGQGPLWLSSKQRQRYDTYVAYLRYPGKGARVLDVGCGPGHFLVKMRAAGWEVCGIEPNPKAAAAVAAAGLDVRVGMLETLALPEGHFDAVSLHHVIEHLHDPIATLRLCLRVLKPGGVITVATPNFEAAGHRVFGPDWFPLIPPRHLVLFTAASLSCALAAAGFQPEPAIRLRLGAHEMFRRGMHIRNGSCPRSEQPPLPALSRLKARWLAWRADRATCMKPELAEELVLLARRPGPAAVR